MQVTVVHRYCDAHVMLSDERVEEGTTTKTYNLGDGDLIIEICEWCEENLSIKDLRLVLKEAGQTPEDKEESPNGKRGMGRPRRSIQFGGGKAGDYTANRPTGPHKCKFCDEKGYTTPQGMHLHEFRWHPWSRLKWEEDTDYLSHHPVTLESKRGREERLAALTTMNIDLEEAVRREKFATERGFKPGWRNGLEAALQFLTLPAPEGKEE